MKYILPLLLCAVLLICVFGGGVETKDVARIHVVANSDSAKDIEVKMKVAKAITELIKNEKFDSLDNIEKGLLDRLLEIENKANSILEEEGFSYGALADVGVKYFDRKSLGNSAFPEGEYLALTVTLGQGKGHNWWSVLFPDIAFEASLAFGEEGTKGKSVVVGGGNIIRIRSFLVDMFHRLVYWQKE